MLAKCKERSGTNKGPAGIGTYVVSGSLSHTSVRARLNSWYTKAKDSAIGSSFDQHVVGGYRFLMRFYNPGDEIYMFGFSRGAYIARFLAEMLDYIGLLSHGNEEMVKFAWKAFAQWQCRSQSAGSEEEIAKADEEKKKMYAFMKGFRETFSRPVGRIKFLGLFDTVNSVPRFETAWMQRSKFPYTARSSAKVIRHAVAIDERRAKFRQDLMYQGNPKAKNHRHRYLGEWLGFDYWNLHNNILPQKSRDEKAGTKRSADNDEEVAPDAMPSESAAQPKGSTERGRPTQKFLSPQHNQPRPSQPQRRGSQFAPYRARSTSRRRPSPSPQAQGQNFDATSDNMSGLAPSDIDPNWDEDGQDIDEVWFSGGHADVGGGWEMLEDSKSASHVPLAWIVREAMRAGLPFDAEKVAEMGCACTSEWDPQNPSRRPAHVRKQAKQQRKQNRKANMDVPSIRMEDGGNIAFPESPPATQPSASEKRPTTASSTSSSASDSSDEEEHHFHSLMNRAHSARIHDSLQYGGGLGPFAVSAWKFMEYLPFLRMDLQSDGSWEPIRWPLPRGEVRDVPENVRVHGSVLRRMQEDENYRPGNLIIGGGGRGVRHAPRDYNEVLGDWVCVADRGDPIGEIWMRREKPNPDEEKNSN